MPTFLVICKGALLGLALYLVRRWITSRWGTFNKVVSCTDRIFVITGATSGIGRATAEELAKRGGRVVLACRDLEQANKVALYLSKTYKNCQAIALKLDLSDFDSVDLFLRRCKSQLPRIDVLILNAGVAFCPYTETSQGLELQMGVNHFGHARLTLGLLSLLKKSQNARVIQVSSSLHKNSNLPERLNALTGEANIRDLCLSRSSYSKKLAYADSKLAGMLFMKEMSRKYQTIRWYSVSPGIVNTKLGRHRSTLFYILCLPLYIPFALVAVRTPLQGSQSILYASLDDDIEPTFGYFRDCKQQKISSLLVNCSLSERLFSATQEIINRCDSVE